MERSMGNHASFHYLISDTKIKMKKDLTVGDITYKIYTRLNISKLIKILVIYII